MASLGSQEALLSMFEILIDEMKKKKIIKANEIPRAIIYELMKMTNNNLNNILTKASTYIESEYLDALKSEKLIQQVTKDEIKKYTLTMKGISYCINIKYDISYENQFKSFLECFDEANTSDSEDTNLDWKEKLATLTLLLMSSTSEASAIILDEELNQKIFESALKETLETLQEYGIFKEKYELPVTRGEPPGVLLMRSRVTELPRKTNQIYKNIGHGRGYYLDLEKGADVDELKISFILSKILENYDTETNYTELKTRLLKISEKYHPQFLTRKINSKIFFGITNKIDSFFESEIWDLPIKN